MWRAGLPAPGLRYEVRTADGRLVGVVDFAWPELRTVGEFDGRIEYGERSLRPGQSAADALFEEKQRGDGVRAEDLGMTRWTWLDIDRFTPVAGRLRSRFRGPAHLLVVRAWPDMRGDRTVREIRPDPAAPGGGAGAGRRHPSPGRSPGSCR